MIKENGIKAFSDSKYDYYELLQDFSVLKKGAIFVHDPDDDMYGSVSSGCLKLCWTPKGNCYSGLCANTVFLHCAFLKDKRTFKKVDGGRRNELMDTIKNLEHQLNQLKNELSCQ